MPNWKKVIVSGSDAVLSSVTATAGLTVTGSVKATAGFTGSLQGTASYAFTAQTVTVGQSSSAAIVNATGLHKFFPLFGSIRNLGDSNPVDAYYVNSSSFQYIMGTNTLTVTSSYATQALSSSFAISASFTPNAIVTASVSLNTITFTKGNGTTFPITVNTGSGSGGGATSPGGSTTQIQYNNAGAFGGVPNLTWNGTTLNATGSFSGYFIPKHVSGSLSVAGASYIIYNPGIYCFTATDEYMVNTIRFPDPSSIPAGQTITIINRDTYEANYGGSYTPVLPNGDPVTSAPGVAQTYVNIDSQWILVSNTK